MLKDLNLKSVYDSSECNLITKLFIPLLSESFLYKRGVGYFTSGWLRLAAKGLDRLAENGGKVKLVTSPHLETNDWKSFVRGNKAQKDDLLYKSLRKKVSNLGDSLAQNTLTALAWLIADGILEVKFAIPNNNLGDFHDKFAIFEDYHGDKVAIHGSYNDSIKGNLNGESFSVFKSWVKGQSNYVEHHIDRFENIYSDQNDFFQIYNMPQAIRNEIVKLRKIKIVLITFRIIII